MIKKELVKSVDIVNDNVVKFHLTIYRVEEYEVSIKDYGNFATISVNKYLDNLDNTYSKYLPNIYADVFDVNDCINPSIEIQTTSYGALNLDDFTIYLEALEKAKIVSEYIMSDILLQLIENYKNK